MVTQFKLASRKVQLKIGYACIYKGKHTSPARFHLMKFYEAKLSFLYVVQFNCTTLKHAKNAEGIIIQRRRRQRHCTPWFIRILNSSQELLPQLRSIFIHPGGHSMSILVLSFSKCFSESSIFRLKECKFSTSPFSHPSSCL